MTPADFTLRRVPCSGALAPLRDLVGEGDLVCVEVVPGGAWRGRITAREGRTVALGWLWLGCEMAWFCAPRSRICDVDLTRSPAARSAVVAWLAAQGHTDAGASDAALLSALRAVCGLPAVVPDDSPDTDTDTNDIPF